ncbi:MAG: hypothetical protein ACREJ3_00170 [Polyangiaceae bacterium]
MAEGIMIQKQNVTVQLDRETIRKAKVIAAHRGTSVSQLLAGTIAGMVREDEEYQRAHARALELLRRGMHLGGKIRATRDELHER